MMEKGQVTLEIRKSGLEENMCLSFLKASC